MLEDKVKIGLIVSIIFFGLAMFLNFEQVVLVFSGAVIGILVPASGGQNASETEK
jgi:membrane protease YdiL (CAAX protease family)